ncbi:MAG TPA: hypothetical protein VN852_06720 [Candidatus Krumholzibacteria bacterium]|nr:hypothetical protein [Candidatus Krumholzibacteria bacterium]
MRSISSRRPWRVFAAVLVATVICCGSDKKPADTALSSDEKYLVDAYVRVRRAGALLPVQREVADSLLNRLGGEVDTLRVARAIAALNATPERWPFIMQKIEESLGNNNSSAPSESARG